MPSIIRATTTSGLQVAPDNSGSLQLQTNGTTTAVTIDTSQNVGIGASPANDRLVINGSTNINSAIRLQNQGNNIGFISTLASWQGSGSDNTFTVASIGALAMMFATNSVERMRIDSSGNFTAVIPSGSTSYPAFWCRAWVNFNGTGTVAIRGSGNVTSITDNGTGAYTVNFTTAMPDANYCTNSTGTHDGGAYVAWGAVANDTPPTTSAVRTDFLNTAGSLVDVSFAQVSIFR